MTHINSVDATTGQPIITRVLSRKAELEAVRQTLPETALQALGDIDLALQTIETLLTGDHANIPAVVVADMNKWLEQNKHLAERPIDDDAPATNDAVATEPPATADAG